MSALLSYGEVLIDFLPDNDNGSYYPMAGGAPANVAVAYSKLGGRSFFAGGISTDNFGVMLKQQLQQEGVNTQFVKDVEKANTAMVLVSLDREGERSFNFYRHETADTQYGKAQINHINWQDISLFHFCSNTLTSKSINSSTLYALKKAKLNNTLISFDVNLRQQLWADLNLLPQRVQAAIALSDIVKFSREEADYLALQNEMRYKEYIAKLISCGVKLIIVTDGANDVQVVSESFTEFFSVPNITAVDTTAAGDSFIASFLFAITQQSISTGLARTLIDLNNVTTAISFAAKCGAYTCQRKGAFSALPSMTDI